MRWYIGFAIVVIAMFLPSMVQAGGKGVIVAPVPPIVLPDTPDECGCPQNMKDLPR